MLKRLSELGRRVTGRHLLTLGLALPLGLALLPTASCNINTTDGNGTGGNTFSTRCLAWSAILRPTQRGQKARCLQLRATRRLWAQSSQRKRAKP